MNIDNDKYDYSTNNHIVTNLVVIDSNHRNTNLNPNVNNFTIDLEKANQSAFRDVLGMKLVSYTIYGGSINLTPSSIYLQINDYKHAIVGTSSISSAFANFVVSATGVTHTDTSSVLLECDPNTHIFNPVLGNLRKFNVSLLNSDGSLFNMQDYKISMTFAVYTKRVKYTRN